ncbi:MAG: hypothetical protein WCO84_06395 [bacterium]
MGTRDKVKNQMKQRQKAALKSKARVKSRVKLSSKSKVSSGMLAMMAEELFPNDQWIFWAAHGVNMLLSDFDNGTWTPMFEGLYEGNVPLPGDMAKALVDKYGPDNDQWTPEAKAALAWLAQSREVGFIYKSECLNRLKAKGDTDPEVTARLPHNSVVWEVFSELKGKLIARKTI